MLLDTEREEVAEEKRRDYKTILQEFVQRTPNQTLSYRLFGESGPDHDKTFYFEVLLNGGAVGKGAGRSKKEAPTALTIRLNPSSACGTFTASRSTLSKRA